MKRKEIKELHTKTIEELNTLLKETRDLFLKMRLDLTRNRVKNTRGIFLMRKDMARILTIINQKEVMNDKSA